jgi:thioredoxin reductase (NADPH)
MPNTSLITGGIIMADQNRKHENLIIVGGGPGGLSASIYAARNGVNPLVLNGPEPGGQISTTSELENYPGFPEPIGGFELTQKMTQQAENFGVRLEYESAEKIAIVDNKFIVKTEINEYEAETLIIASGAEPKTLGLPREDHLRGNGVSYCATCDAAFFKNKKVAVVGGGDTALWEATFLAKFAAQVYIIHRRGKFRGAKILSDRVKAKENIEIIWDTEVKELMGEDKLSGLKIFNNKNNTVSKLAVDGFFVAIGHQPRTSFLPAEIELDSYGYLVADKHQHTNIPGIFAAGDVQDPDYRQVVIAAGSGAKAAIEASEYLEKNSPTFAAQTVINKAEAAQQTENFSTEQEPALSFNLKLD